jgi:hypothetical protein
VATPQANAPVAETAAATLISVGCAWHFCIGPLQQNVHGAALASNERSKAVRRISGIRTVGLLDQRGAEISLDCTPSENVLTDARDSSYRVAQLLKGSDLSQRGRVSRPPILREKRRRARRRPIWR